MQSSGNKRKPITSNNRALNQNNILFIQEEYDLSQSSNDFVKTKETELTQIKIKLQFVLDSFLDQVIDRESYLTKKEELLSKKKAIEELISGFNKNCFSWLEPMRSWINEAKDCDKVATDSDKQAKKVLALKIFGSNLYLENKKVRGEAQNQWSALGADPTSRTMVPRRGLEPPLHKCGTGS